MMRAALPLIPAMLIFPVGVAVVDGPVGKLLWATVGLLFLLKIGSLIRNVQLSLPLPKKLGWFVYFLMWPGMRPESFSRIVSGKESVGREFVTGFVFFISGVLAQLLLIVFWDSIQSDIRLYLGLFSFLILVHFGFSSILFVMYRLCGWPVEPLFKSPFRSDSLRDFWGQRWNLAFVDMDKRLLLPLFPKQIGKGLTFFGIFLLSGILHELAISYPVNSGWGLPLSYFLIHGFLTILEPSIPLIGRSILLRRLWVWLALFAPVPLLFHKPFLTTFIQPYFEFAHSFVNTIPMTEVFYWSILACGVGHFLILFASFQVPQKLGWKKDFAVLSRFNQKIFWTYGGYIVFCIVAFALVDLFNVQGLIERHPSSVAIAAFIALFWTVRVIVDFGYFKHDDWPKGDIFIVGHTCLTALFSCLAIVHWSLVFWHLM